MSAQDNVNYLSGETLPEDRNIKTGIVGTTQGVFNVSQTGAATYSIPIFTPPGINGIQPNISINYNSQSGNGILGLGWNFSGLSAITRIPKNYYYHGKSAPIKINKTDKFSLDGNPLVLHGTVAYGFDVRNSVFDTVFLLMINRLKIIFN